MPEASGFQELFRQGTILLQSGKANRAVPVLEEAHRLAPDHLDAALNLSGAYILSGKFKQAVPLLESLSESAPDNAMVWTNLGAAYLGNPILAKDDAQQAAMAAFKRALALDPLATSVAYNIGLVHRDRREFEEATYWFKQALETDPGDRDALNVLRRLEGKLSSEVRNQKPSSS